jgi:hypothetical protein
MSLVGPASSSKAVPYIRGGLAMRAVIEVATALPIPERGHEKRKTDPSRLLFARAGPGGLGLSHLP